MQHLASLAVVVMSALPLAACTTSSPDAFAQRTSELEGIYRVESHLKNEVACTPDGSPVENTHGFALVQRSAVFGTELLQVTSCPSLADCQARLASGQLGGLLTFSFTLTAMQGDALTGFEVTSGWTDGGTTCAAPTLADIALTGDGSSLRIESAIRVGADYTSPDGVCTTERGRSSAELAPCSQMETLSATFVEPL